MTVSICVFLLSFIYFVRGGRVFRPTHFLREKPWDEVAGSPTPDPISDQKM